VRKLLPEDQLLNELFNLAYQVFRPILAQTETTEEQLDDAQRILERIREYLDTRLEAQGSMTGAEASCVATRLAADLGALQAQTEGLQKISIERAALIARLKDVLSRGESEASVEEVEQLRQRLEELHRALQESGQKWDLWLFGLPVN